MEEEEEMEGKEVRKSKAKGHPQYYFA